MDERKPYSENKKAYNMKYAAKNIKHIPFDVQKTYYADVIKPYADKKGYPVNTFIKKCIAYCIDHDTDLSEY